MITQTVTVVARAKAFSSEPLQTYRFRVGADGTVRVYDSVAGHYTVCHSLSASAERRIRRLAVTVPGARVEAGKGEEHDTGEVVAFDGGMATVAWDSGVTTTCPAKDLRLTTERWSGGMRME